MDEIDRLLARVRDFSLENGFETLLPLGLFIVTFLFVQLDAPIRFANCQGEMRPRIRINVLSVCNQGIFSTLEFGMPPDVPHVVLAAPDTALQLMPYPAATDFGLPSAD